MSGTAQYGIQTKITVRDHVADENDAHIVAGIRQRGFAGTEEHQDGVQERKADGCEEDADDDVQADGIA